MQKAKIVFFGTPDFVVPILNSLHQNFDLKAVVTTPDQPQGRKMILTSTPVSLVAQSLGLPIFKPEQLNDSVTLKLKNLKPDLFVVASYGKIVPQQILDIPKYGSINIHPSNLPKFRGPSPIQAQILDGIENSAVSFILMDPEIDHGPLIFKEKYLIKPDDTFKSLQVSMFKRASELLPGVIEDFIRGKITAKEQNHKEATFTNHIERQNGYFEIQNPPSKEKLHKMIRAYFPWPSVWTKWNGKIVKFFPDEKIQMEGKNPVSLKDFLNGYPDFPDFLSAI